MDTKFLTLADMYSCVPFICCIILQKQQWKRERFSHSNIPYCVTCLNISWILESWLKNDKRQIFSCSQWGKRSEVNEHYWLKFNENVRNGVLHYWWFLVLVWEGRGVPVKCTAVKLLELVFFFSFFFFFLLIFVKLAMKDILWDPVY